MLVMSDTYHIPVMPTESIEGLNIKPKGVYVDATFGGGGHSALILDQLEEGRLFAFDQDAEAEANMLADERFTLLRQNFRYLKNNLRAEGVTEVDGILADLGISSHQIDASGRGFSTRFDEPLDMRMNQQASLDAIEVVNSYSEEQLEKIFREYGELRSSYKLARTIVHERKNNKISTSGQLRDAVVGLAPPRKEFKFLAQVFQAIRIEVNNELESLRQLLQQSADMLKIGGRLVVISYHSLEDRLVKNFFKSGNFEGVIHKDFYGNPQLIFKLITRRPIVPTDNEIQLNSRARSAKLRVAERIE